MPTTVNMTLENDGDFYQVFQYTLPDGVTPINIAAASGFVFGVRRTLNDAATLFSVTSAGGTVILNGTRYPNGQIQIVDGPNGRFGIWIAKEQLLAAPLGTWTHSLIITLPALPSAFPPTLRTPVWSGSITITNGSSR